MIRILYDENGQQVSENMYQVNGNEWMLQGDIIKISNLLNVFGLHTGYKLTRLEGRFDDVNQERHATHTVVELNGGDDTFFKNVQAHRDWLWPFIDAQYGNAVYLPADGTYNVYVSTTGLYAKKG